MANIHNALTQLLATTPIHYALLAIAKYPDIVGELLLLIAANPEVNFLKCARVIAGTVTQHEIYLALNNEKGTKPDDPQVNLAIYAVYILMNSEPNKKAWNAVHNFCYTNKTDEVSPVSYP